MFKENLVELRSRAGMTQEELAKAIQVSRSVVAKWESGRGLPKIDNLLGLTVLFNTNVERLLQ